jgi:hypothetical protein
MNRRKEILDELTDAAPALTGISPQHPFRVPAGYFDNLAEVILSRVRTEHAGSAKEELDLISPLLGGLSKKMPYSMPDAYFETLTPSVRKAEAADAAPARVVKMFQPQRKFRMAAAAAVIGIIGIASYLFLREPAANQYATKTDTEVQKELDPKVSELTESEIASFVEGSSVMTMFYNNMNDITEDDVKLMLADIPDQELEKYLDQNTIKEKFN